MGDADDGWKSIEEFSKDAKEVGYKEEYGEEYASSKESLKEPSKMNKTEDKVEKDNNKKMNKTEDKVEKINNKKMKTENKVEKNNDKNTERGNYQSLNLIDNSSSTKPYISLGPHHFHSPRFANLFFNQF